jgi:hypothetical protein
MKLAAIVLAVFTLSACAGDTGPHAPPAPNEIVSTPFPAARAFLWGMIVEDSGVCIEGATVRVVRGQRAGESMTQTTPCDAWSFGGFTFRDLTPGVEMTLRASAPGYADEEQTVRPSSGPQQAMLFTPRLLVSVGRD